MKKKLKIQSNHGMFGTPTYKSWSSMMQRCNNPNNCSYKYYGGRGIVVCERWRDFKKFYKDMKDRPIGLELDRINNNKGYNKANCRWVTRKEQMRNTNRIVLNKVIASGVYALRDMGMTKKEISKSLNITEDNVTNVLYKGIWKN